jgi:hypothetical protein
MSDTLERVLELVADGHISAAQAAPILDALAAADLAGDDVSGRAADPEGAGGPGPTGGGRGNASSIRIEVTEGGRKILNLRVPAALGRMALDRIPGLSGTNADLVREALADGRSGTLLHIDDDGDGVRIVLE